MLNKMEPLRKLWASTRANADVNMQIETADIFRLKRMTYLFCIPKLGNLRDKRAGYENTSTVLTEG